MKTENRFPIFSNSFLRFVESNIKDSKICRIIYGMFYKRYRKQSAIFTTENLNYITNRKDGNISYLPAGKEHKENDNGEWIRDGRQDGKPAKVIRKIFTDGAIKRLFTDSDFEIFSNLYKSEFVEEGYILKLLDSSEIPNIYDSEIAEGNGSLQGSCMNGDGGYLDIYACCNKLQILVLYKENDGETIHGRALVWRLPNNRYLLDRIYCTKDFQYNLFLNFAKEREWLHKLEYKSYQNKNTFIDTKTGETISKCFRIYTDTDFDTYPYIDTFQYGGDGFLQNDSCSDCFYTYSETNGNRDGENTENEYECEYSHNYYGESELFYVSEVRGYPLTYSEGYIHERYIVPCYFGYNDERSVCMHDHNIVRINGRYYHEQSPYICYSDYDNEYYLHENCVYVDEYSSYILTDECVEINGDWYHEDSEQICEDINNEVRVLSECIKINGEYYHKESKEYKELKKQLRRLKRNKLGRRNRKQNFVNN